MPRKPRSTTNLYNRQYLTQRLRNMAMDVLTVDDDGDPQTRAELLATNLWNRALGWTETKTDDEGNKEVIHHAPERWAAELLLDRLDGKLSAATATDEKEKPTVASKVGELAITKVNALTPETDDSNA